MNSAIITAISAAFLWTVVNYLDKYLIDKVTGEKKVGSLVIFSALAGIPVIIAILIWDYQIALSPLATEHLLLILAGMVYLIGVVFYLYSLSGDDVSDVIPQLLMIPAFTGLLGYLILDEIPNIDQIAGSIIILIGAFFLNIESDNMSTKKLYFKYKVFLTSAAASIFIALNSTLFKFGALETVPFIDAIFWEHVGFFIFSCIILLFVKSYRNDFIEVLRTKGGTVISLNVAGEIITLLGNFLFHYSTLSIPILLSQIMAEGTQPVFVITIGIILSLYFPNLRDEHISRMNNIKRILCISIIFVGLILIYLAS